MCSSDLGPDDVSADRGGGNERADRLTDPTHPKQLSQRQAIGFWKKNAPRSCIEDDRNDEVINHHCGNGPAGGSEGRADLGRALPDEQNCEECGSSKAKQPYGYLDFSRRVHRVFESNSSGRKKMRLSLKRNAQIPRRKTWRWTAPD